MHLDISDAMFSFPFIRPLGIKSLNVLTVTSTPSTKHFPNAIDASSCNDHKSYIERVAELAVTLLQTSRQG
jgi:hypothetical protein